MQGSLALLPLMAALLALMVCHASGQQPSGGEQPPRNLIANGSFEQAGGSAVAVGWRVTGQAQARVVEGPDTVAGRCSQRLDIARGHRAELTQEVELAPHSQYFFHARVKSNGRVVAYAGALAMSYHRQGEWQTLAGVARSDATGKMTVRFDCGCLGEQPARVTIDDVVLRATKLPETPARKGRFGPTVLVEGGRPAATIVYPSEPPCYRELALQLVDAIRDRTGADLPAVSDVQATTPGPPVLRDGLRETSLVLLGRLGTNRAMWAAYNRFLCAADGYYPGGDGYVVRTASNVFCNGSNHIILGGSTERGAARAVEAFTATLRKAPRANTLTVPWFLGVELGGECGEQFARMDAVWRDTPNHPLLPPLEPGYGTVRRWYENAMGYYWSGWESYRQRSVECLSQVLADRAYTHHYLVEFLCRAHTMLTGSELLSDEQRAELDGLILGNFWDFLQGPDLKWMRVFSPPYDSVSIVNRHQIAPLMGDLTMAEFLFDQFQLDGELAEVVQFRRSEKRAFMDHMVAERWGPSAPGAINASGCHEEIVAAMFRYALANERYQFFEEGRAERALHLDMMDHRTGKLVRPGEAQDHPLLLGMLAHYHRDGRYARLLRAIPHQVHPTGYFQGRYVNGVHRYVPGAELSEQPLDSFAGLRVPQTMTHVMNALHEFAAGSFAKTELADDEVMDFAAFREGFEPDDDYFAVSGLAAHCAPGAILNLTSRGTTWLMGSSGSYFDQNGLHVQRMDRLSDNPAPYPSVAKMDWKTQLRQGGAMAFTLEPFAGMRWHRSIARVADGLFVVRDVVTALEAGEYALTVSWHPNGAGRWDGRVWTSLTNKGRLHITPLGAGVRVRHNADRGESPWHLRLTKAGRMEEGHSETMVTVLQAVSVQDECVYAASLLEPNRVLLNPTPAGAAPVLISWGGKDTEAPLTVGPPDDVSALAAVPVNGMEFEPTDVQDATGRWTRTWEYRGLQRPAMVTGARRLTQEVVDLGRVAELHEIRVTHKRSGPWYPAEMPGGLATALPDADGRLPARDSHAWRPVTQPPEWCEGVHTGNYGQAEPVPNDCQMIKFDGLPARYVRADDPTRLVFYDRLEKAARRPVKLVVANLDDEGEIGVLARPPAYPKFIRSRDIEDDAIALLDASGAEKMRFDAPQDIQCARLLDYTGDGRLDVAVATVDARLRVMAQDGEVLRDLDLFAMHREFNESEGRPTTRHPAGGFTMPYALGLWRRGDDGGAKTVVSRYCAFSFLDESGGFEGVLQAGGYVAADLLAEGVDFDGDGEEEQLCLSRGTLWRISGDAQPYVAEPDGSLFYPQVYRCQPLAEPDWVSTIEGPETFVLEPIRLGEQRDRYVLVVRDNYVGLYDGREHRWAFTWVPLVGMSAATWRQSGDGSIAVSATTRDGILWTLTWAGNGSLEPARLARPIEWDVISMDASAGGDLLMTMRDGLYVLGNEAGMRRIAAGEFSDAKYLFGSEAGSIVAATLDGRVIRLDPKRE